MIETALTKALGIRIPVVQGGMVSPTRSSRSRLGAPPLSNIVGCMQGPP